MTDPPGCTTDKIFTRVGLCAASFSDELNSLLENPSERRLSRNGFVWRGNAERRRYAYGSPWFSCLNPSRTALARHPAEAGKYSPHPFRHYTIQPGVSDRRDYWARGVWSGRRIDRRRFASLEASVMMMVDIARTIMLLLAKVLEDLRSSPVCSMMRVCYPQTICDRRCGIIKDQNSKLRQPRLFVLLDALD